MRMIGQARLARLVLAIGLIGTATAGAVASEHATHKLIELQALDADNAGLPPAHLRRAVAGVAQEECRVALSRLPPEAPSVGLTEDAAPDFPAAQRELARWRLRITFSACVSLSGQIIESAGSTSERHAWIELARLIAEEHTVRELIELADVLPLAHGSTEVYDAFRIAHWHVLRDVIFGRMLLHDL